MSSSKIILTCAMALVLVCGSTADAKKKASAQRVRKVEAVKGKRYNLHPAHGPHMVLVTTLRNVAYGADGGLSAEEAADEIVYQLRLKGIPAYVYHQEKELSQQKTFVARQAGVAIMAGNFPSHNHRHAKLVLKHIQEKFSPSFLKDQETGAIIVQQSPDTPFKRAFLTLNPLRSDVESEGMPVDKDLVEMNSRNGKVSLLKNKGRYSVKVASFSGRTVVQTSGYKSEKALGLLGESDESARQAWELATALREARKYGYAKNYEAWVLHDYRKSYVTIGSFNSPDDPRVKQLIAEFQAKDKPNPKTGRPQLTPELFSIPKNPVGTLPDKLWFFDQDPRPVRVPGT